MKMLLYALLTCFAFTANSLFSQSANIIKGKIVNDKDNLPVANCSVFINSTSKGSITNSLGEFELLNIPAGKYELIVSSIGYNTYVYAFSTSQLPLELNIRLLQKATDLSEITIEPFESNGWENWGQTFIENLIGTTNNASACVIKNKEVVHFRFSKKNNRLTAIADEPLIIENKALGYIIKFQMEEFSADFNSNTSIYSGYPLFSDIETTSKMAKLEWKDSRKKSYQGSLMHFIRCLYNNELQLGNQFNQEGFEVRREIKLPNPEKLRVKEIYKNGNQKIFQEDSLNYYKKIMKQSDSLLYNQIITATDILTSGNDTLKSVFFTKRLNIIFRKKRKIDTEVQKSTIYLITPIPVQIEENGNYAPPLELFVIGYWAKWQKLANMLPLDYWPEDE